MTLRRAADPCEELSPSHLRSPRWSEPTLPVAWSFAARAQRGERVRRIGVLFATAYVETRRRRGNCVLAQGGQERRKRTH
jgi:hypothetical protein